MTGTALVTGSAGFIGYHMCARLLREGWTVVGLDSLNPYYDVRLKEARHARLEGPGFTPLIGRIEEPGLLSGILEQHRPQVIIHLAAQAGVRHSIDAPRDYMQSNLAGAFEMLEAVRAHPPAHLMMASTSSVYGANTELPYGETQKTDLPMSFYAATKKANEVMAHSYAHLYGIPTTMFRFFTVYGPWGRPDMALFKFVRAMFSGEPIELYNHGDMLRDFTYVDDLIEGLWRLMNVAPDESNRVDGDSLSPVAPWRVVNVGHGAPVRLGDFVAAIERATGLTAERRLLDMQPGDVPRTWAGADLLEALVGAPPRTDLDTGVAAFVDWYRQHWNR